MPLTSITIYRPGVGRQLDPSAPGRGEAEQVPGRHRALGPGEQQPGGRPPPEGQAGDGLRGALHGQRAPQPALRVPERDEVAEGETQHRAVTAPAAGSTGQAAELEGGAAGPGGGGGRPQLGPGVLAHRQEQGGGGARLELETCHSTQVWTVNLHTQGFEQKLPATAF